MKKLFLALSTIFLVKMCYSQNIYQDAVQLGSDSKISGNVVTISSDSRAENDAILSILNKYFPNIASLSSDSINKIIQKNPFLRDFKFSGTTQAQTAIVQVQTMSESVTLNNFGNSVNNLNVSGLASGVAQFLINRAKDELTIAFFNKFKKFADKHPEFRILFPTTYGNLTTFPSYNYQQWLPALRDGFYKDIKGITGKLEGIFNTADFVDLSNKFPEASITIRLISLIDNIKSGKLSVVDAVDKLAGFPEFANISVDASIDYKNFVSSLKLLDIFSQAIKTNGHSITGWVSTTEIKNLFLNDIERQIFLGLIYQEVTNKKIQFYVDQKAAGAKKSAVVAENFSDLMAKKEGIVDSLSSDLSKLIDIGTKVGSLEGSFIVRQKKGDTISKTDYFNYIDTIIMVVQDGLRIAGQFDPQLSATKYITLVAKVDEIYQNIYEQKYPQAVLNLVYILNNINKGKNNSVANLSSDINTYGLLIANLVIAKSSNDVQTAIENAVLPVGSYSVKQNSTYNVSVNGYIGYQNEFNYAQGIYAPIGFSFSWEVNKFLFFKNFTITGFVPVFDLGSIVLYQLSNPTTTATTSTNNTTGSQTVNTSSLNQQIKLGSLFSPGGAALFEWHGLPFAFGGGYRRTPTLYYSSGSTYSTIASRAVWFGTILIDIPLFTLHNSPKN